MISIRTNTPAKPPVAHGFFHLSTAQLAFVLSALTGKSVKKLATLEIARKRVTAAAETAFHLKPEDIFAALTTWRDSDVDHEDPATLRAAIEAFARVGAERAEIAAQAPARPKPSIATIGGLPVAPKTLSAQASDDVSALISAPVGARAVDVVKRDPKPQSADEAFQASRSSKEKAGAIASATGMLAGDKSSRFAGVEKLVRLGVPRAEIDALVAKAATGEIVAAPVVAKKRSGKIEIAALASGPEILLLEIQSNSDRIGAVNAKATLMRDLAIAGDVAGLRAIRSPGMTGWSLMLNTYRDALLARLAK